MVISVAVSSAIKSTLERKLNIHFSDGVSKY